MHSYFRTCDVQDTFVCYQYVLLLQVSRDYNLDCFLRDNLVFSESVQYSYEPQDDDPVSTIS